MKLRKLIGIIGIVVLVLNLILRALNIVSWQLFWVIIIIFGVIAYFIMPRIK